MEKHSVRANPALEKKVGYSNISILPDQLYLIMRNGSQIIGYVDTYSKGIQIIKHLGDEEMKKLEKPSLKVMKQDFDDGKEIQICTQSLGKYWDGRIKKVTLFSIVPVSKTQYRS